MKLILLMSAFAIAAPLSAQKPCANQGDWGDGKRANHCEMREYTLADTGRLTVDSGTNGGIKIIGSDRSNVLVTARVQTSAATPEEAKALSAQVQVQATPGMVRVEGPSSSNSAGWGVSYVIQVPRRSGLTLKAHNGGVSIADVEGQMSFETVNGGIRLERVGGDVRGRTVNGGVRVALEGSTWRGNQLDLITTNGGIKVSVPEGYSARLETSTTNGRVHSDHPGMVNARNTGNKRDTSLSMTLGSGGPLVRLVTTNGGVHVGKA